jgi:hypothetical protein
LHASHGGTFQAKIFLTVGHLHWPEATLEEDFTVGVVFNKHYHNCLVVANELVEMEVLEWLDFPSCPFSSEEIVDLG